MTEMDDVMVREGKNVKGRLLAVVLGRVGKGVLQRRSSTRSRRSRRATTGAGPMSALGSIIRGVAASALGTLAMDVALSALPTRRRERPSPTGSPPRES